MKRSMKKREEWKRKSCRKKVTHIYKSCIEFFWQKRRKSRVHLYSQFTHTRSSTVSVSSCFCLFPLIVLFPPARSFLIVYNLMLFVDIKFYIQYTVEEYSVHIYTTVKYTLLCRHIYHLLTISILHFPQYLFLM